MASSTRDADPLTRIPNHAPGRSLATMCEWPDAAKGERGEWSLRAVPGASGVGGR